MQSFKDTVKAARVERGLSLSALAAILGTFKSYVSGIENGKVAAPSPKLVLLFAKALRLDKTELLLLSEASKTAPEVRSLFQEAAQAIIRRLRAKALERKIKRATYTEGRAAKAAGPV